MAEQDLYISPYKKMAQKFHQIINHLKQSVLDDGEIVKSVGPLKELNSNHFQFQASVYRDLEAEVNGDKFSGFSKLVSYLTNHLGKPKEKSQNSVAWETIQSGKDNHIRISMVVYNDGSAETYSVKITIGSLNSDLL